MANRINRHPNFGVTAISPIKGRHAIIKAYLQCGYSALKGIFTKLQLLYTAQHSTIKTTTAQHQIPLNHAVNIPLLGAILGKVH